MLERRQGCSEGDIDDQRAAEITNSYVVRFLGDILLAGPSITSTPPDDVRFQSR